MDVRARVNGRPYDKLLNASYVEEGLQVDESGVDTWASPVQGTVYGTLLNDHGSLRSMAEELHQPPYKKPPVAPVLFIKPMNTFSSHKSNIILPDEEEHLQIGASVGLVMGKQATKVKEEEAYEYIEGYTLVNDVSIPHKSIFRPAIQEKSRDGFCPIGPWIVPREAVKEPEQMQLNVYINQDLKQQCIINQLVRPIPQLLADVTAFMTLNEGDVLMVGCGTDLPRATDGDTVRIESSELGVLENTIRRVRS